ncbi:MAG: T9SS type A sorting domain-containing protein [Bacteroidota bacterium]
MNSNGDISAKLTFPVEDSCFSDIDRIIPLSSSEFLTIGGYRQKNSANAQLWVMKIDTGLNIIWDNKYFTNRPFTTNMSVTENSGGNLVIGSALTTGNPNNFHSIVFLKITKDGDSLRSKFFNNGDMLSTDLQSLIWIDGNYKAFVEGFQSYTGNNCFSQILQLDSNLNLLEVRPTPYIIERYLTAEKRNENEYFLAGKAYSTATHYDVAIAKLDKMEDSLDFNRAGKPGKTADYSGWMQCLSIANSNSIYTGGTGNYTSGFYCSSKTRVLMLSNYDSLLNCRWTRFYGSEACYTLSTMDATSDGGCIIAGMYYDPDNPGNMLDVIIIKVDSTGLFTDLPENKTVFSHQAILYPNPGNDYLVIQSGQQIKEAMFSLYDASGCQVLETRLENTIEQRDVSQLPAGSYPWQIIFNRKVVEKGIWIKR